jgi:Methyltransferase domain
MIVTLPDALAAIEQVEGWLSAEQARQLFERAAAVPPGGTIVEIGSCRGRSTIILGLAAGEGVAVIAIDPHAGNDRGPGEWQTTRMQGEADRVAFEENLARAGVADRVRHLRLRSSDAHTEIVGDVALLFVDGAHRYSEARGDISGWGRRVAPGDWMLVHDAFSSVGVTLAILRELALGSLFIYRGRSRSLALYQRATAPLGLRDRTAGGLNHLRQLPWFARNLAIKLALATGLESGAAALGHRVGEGLPY